MRFVGSLFLELNKFNLGLRLIKFDYRRIKHKKKAFKY